MWGKVRVVHGSDQTYKIFLGSTRPAHDSNNVRVPQYCGSEGVEEKKAQGVEGNIPAFP